MKIKTIFLMIIFLIHFSLFAENRFKEGDFILTQKTNNAKDSKKRPVPPPKDKEENTSVKPPEKVNLKKTKEAKTGGRFGDKRF